MPCDDCSRAENCPPCVSGECPANDNGAHCFKHGGESCCFCGADVPEPPMTAEEEEEAPEDEALAQFERDVLDGKAGGPVEEPSPPQPERRPPYAVAYAIEGGHRYELLVPGDATVVAEDGVLKVAHGVLGMDIDPVLGITYIRPVTARAVARKEGAGGADAEDQDPGPLRVE